MAEGCELGVKIEPPARLFLRHSPLEMPDATEILAAAKEAAQAVAAWGEATSAVVAATEAHIHALAEAAAQEDAQASYNAARNIEDEEGGGLGGTFIRGGWSSSFAVRREAATALQAKRIAEAAAAEAKLAAEAALQKAATLAGQTQ